MIACGFSAHRRPAKLGNQPHARHVAHASVAMAAFEKVGEVAPWLGNVDDGLVRELHEEPEIDVKDGR
jgi:hypothetical protein